MLQKFQLKINSLFASVQENCISWIQFYLHCSRLSSLSSRYSAAWLLPSFWRSRTSLPSLFTGEWLRRSVSHAINSSKTSRRFVFSILNWMCIHDLFQQRILVATNLFGRGMDIERVNIVFNYDMPEDSDTYLHRVARAGRFGTKVNNSSFWHTSQIIINFVL